MADNIPSPYGSQGTNVFPGTVTAAAVFLPIVRDQVSTQFTSGGSSTAVLTFPASPKAGATVLVAMANSSGAITVTDNGTSPATFTADVSNTANSNNIYIFRASNITLPASGSYQVTISGGTTIYAAGAVSYLNMAPGGPLNTFKTTGTGTAPAAGGLGVLVFSAFSDSNAATHSVTLNPGAFTSQFTSNASAGLGAFGAADYVATAAPVATQTATWTLGASSPWEVASAGYMPQWAMAANLDVQGTLVTTHNTLDDGSGNVTIAGSLATAHSTLDDGSGNTTIAGQLTANGGSLEVHDTVTSSFCDIAGASDGNKFSYFTLSDLASHQWAFTHELNHSFQYSYFNGSTFIFPFQITTAGAVATAHNTLDDGSGNATFAGTAASYNSKNWINAANRFGLSAGGSASANVTALQNAVNAAVSAGGGMVYIPGPGTYQFNSGITKDLQNTQVGIWMDPGVVLAYTGSGDFLRIYDSSSYGSRSFAAGTGIFGYGTLDGSGSSAAAASAGLHIGDIFQLSVFCTVRNWDQHSGSIGVWFDNNYYYSEQLNTRIFAESCSTCVQFDHSASTGGTPTGSYDRAIADIFIDTNGLGDGVTLANGAQILEGRLGIYGNANTSTTQYAVLRLTGSDGAGFSGIIRSMLYMGVECDDAVHTPPYTIFFGSGSNLVGQCTGVVDFSAANPFTSSNNSGNFSHFIGNVKGDSALASQIPAGSTNIADGNQTLPANATTAITSITAPVAAFTAYKLDLYIPHLGAGAAGTCTFAFGGPGIGNANLDIELWTGTTLTAHTQNSSSSTINAATPAASQRAIIATGSIYWSTSGTVTVTGTITAGGSTVTVNAGAYIILTQIEAP